MARIQSVFVGVASMSLESPRRIEAVPNGRTFMVQTLNLRMADGSVAEVVLHFEENSPHLVLSIAPTSDGPASIFSRVAAQVIDKAVQDGHASIGATPSFAGDFTPEQLQDAVDKMGKMRLCRRYGYYCRPCELVGRSAFCEYCGEPMP